MQFKSLSIFFSALICFFQIQAWSQVQPSCPVLDGGYKCEDADASIVLNFTTKLENNIYTYSINGHSFVANGVAAVDGSSATCSADSVTVHMQLQVQSGICSTSTGVDSVTEWTLQPNAVLQNDLTTILCAGKPPMNIRKQTLCHKI